MTSVHKTIRQIDSLWDDDTYYLEYDEPDAFSDQAMYAELGKALRNQINQEILESLKYIADDND